MCDFNIVQNYNLLSGLEVINQKNGKTLWFFFNCEFDFQHTGSYIVMLSPGENESAVWMMCECENITIFFLLKTYRVN